MPTELSTNCFQVPAGPSRYAKNVASRFTCIAEQKLCVPQNNNNKQVCLDCGASFSGLYSLKRHKKTVCGKNRNPNGEYKCELCGKTYDSKGSLSRHLKSQCKFQKIKIIYVCIFCKEYKFFTQLCSLKRHIKTYHKEQYINKQLLDNCRIISTDLPLKIRSPIDLSQHQSGNDSHMGDNRFSRSDTAIFSLPPTNSGKSGKK